MLDILLALLAILFAIGGIIGCIVPMIPGNVLSYIALICVACTGFSAPSTFFMLITLAATVIVMLIDFYLPAVMTRKFGGTRAGAIGATVGVFVGLLFGPFGIIFGPFFGAVLGELTRDKKNSAQAFKSGLGSFLAFLLGTGAKLAVAIYLLCYIIGECWTPMVEGVKGFF